MLADYHMHTFYSDDSSLPMETAVRKAICLGFDEIQLTGGRRDPNRGDEAALEQLRQSYLAQYRKGEPK